MPLTRRTDDSRRSTRLAISIPVELSFVDEQGNARLERTQTVMVNRHGTMVRSRSPHKVGSQLYLGLPRLGRRALCRVARCSQIPDPHSKMYDVGLELEQENFWSVESPPADWQPAGLASLPAPPPAEAGPEALDALLSLLEEKRLLTRQEFYERLEQVRRARP